MALNNACHKVCWLTSGGRGETGDERPHKRLSKFDPFRASRAAGSGKPEMRWLSRVLTLDRYSSTALKPAALFGLNGRGNFTRSISNTLSTEPVGLSARSIAGLARWRLHRGAFEAAQLSLAR